MKKSKSKKPILDKKLKSYAAIAASALATNASSQVVYTNINDTTLINNGDFFDIDFNNDGIQDVRINLAFSSTSYSSGSRFKYYNVSARSVNSNGASLNGSANIYSYFEVKAFSTNSSISNSANAFNSYGYLGWYSSYAISSSSGTFRSGQFAGAGQKFAGVRFQIGTATHFGWIRLDVPLANNSVTIYDFAYDTTANAPILAGDTGVAVGIGELNREKINVFSTEASLRFPNGLSKNSEFRIYDLKGQLQERGRIAQGKEIHQLKSDYQGVYIVEINNEEGTFRKKLWLESE